MPIQNMTLENEQCDERSKMKDAVEELRKATPKSLWNKDLDELDQELDVRIKINKMSFVVHVVLDHYFNSESFCLFQELDKTNAQAEEARKKSKGQVKNLAATKFSKAAPKNPRKNTKKANNAAAETVAETTETAGAAMEIGKLRLVRSMLCIVKSY